MTLISGDCPALAESVPGPTLLPRGPGLHSVKCIPHRQPCHWPLVDPWDGWTAFLHVSFPVSLFRAANWTSFGVFFSGVWGGRVPFFASLTKGSEFTHSGSRGKEYFPPLTLIHLVFKREVHKLQCWELSHQVKEKKCTTFGF